jgi:hypothetical protein
MKFKFSVILNFNLNSYKLNNTHNKSYTAMNNTTFNMLELRMINKFWSIYVKVRSHTKDKVCNTTQLPSFIYFLTNVIAHYCRNM